MYWMMDNDLYTRVNKEMVHIERCDQLSMDVGEFKEHDRRTCCHIPIPK